MLIPASAPAPGSVSAPAPASASAPAPASAQEAPADDEPPLPDGFVRAAEEGETRCGDLRIQVQPLPGGSYHRFVRVLGPDDKRVYEAHGRRYQVDTALFWEMDLSVELCGDLTGDGIPELVLTESTVGAHCCYTHHAVSMTSPPRRLLMWEKGDAGTPILPVKYRPGPAWQLEGRVVVWPPFEVEKGDPALSYAGAPLVPVVFSLVGGEYKMTSLSFPEAYRKDRDAIHAACAKDPDGCFGDLIAWIDSLVIGDWALEKARMQDADLRQVLDRRSAAMKKILSTQFGSERHPVSMSPKP